MNREIRLLDDLTINKIAAGEVVESPHSVVKELVENAIDAASSAIILEIQEGGKKYIRITDNGVGIKEEYVEAAFMRHSTSKIAHIEDLSRVESLGFRGEALASIAAVAQVEMITRPEGQQHGVLIHINGGKVETIKKVGCPVGTTIIVKNLFFNTPARLKFLKSNNGETMKITEIITRLSLSNPSISFKYINNNNIMFTTPGNNMLSQAILSVFNKETFKNLILLEDHQEGMTLHGYIGQPSFVRGNRNLQIVFINGRYVKNKVISRAIEAAYKEKIMINKYPICILNLKIHPSVLDVNVHPAKIEVKFEDEEKVYHFILKAILKALEKQSIVPNMLELAPRTNIDKKQPQRQILKVVEEKQEDIVIGKSLASIQDQMSVQETKENYSKNLDFTSLKTPVEIVEEQIQIASVEDHNIVQSSFLNSLLDRYHIVGQIFSTYIILENEGSMYLIDQHAAHERLLYNTFRQEIKAEKVASQRLLAPMVLELSKEDYMFLLNHLYIFEKLGFEIENFGGNDIIIRQVPMILGRPQNFSFIYEILDEVRKYNDVNAMFEDTIAKKACKEAIKANDKMDSIEIRKLIEDLSKLTPPLTCPHGRPIILAMQKYEIEKHFKRIQ